MLLCYLRFACWRVEASFSIKNTTTFVSEIAQSWKKRIVLHKPEGEVSRACLYPELPYCIQTPTHALMKEQCDGRARGTRTVFAYGMLLGNGL